MSTMLHHWSEEDLVARAQKAIGDQDTIRAAGFLNPKGANRDSIWGGVEGADVGDDLVGTVGGVVAGVVGSVAGKEEAAEFHGEPVVTLLAVSDSKVYAFAQPQIHDLDTVKLYATWDRDKVEVTVHRRIMVRTLKIEDIETKRAYEYELPRVSWGYHGNLIVNLLTHGIEEDAEVESEPAPS